MLWAMSRATGSTDAQSTSRRLARTRATLRPSSSLPGAMPLGGRSRNNNKSRRKINSCAIVCLSFCVLLFLQIMLLRSVSTIDPISDKGLKPRMRRNQNPKKTANSMAAPSFLYNKPLPLKDDTQFPPWVSEYVQWHSEMRKKFPGMQLFDNPDAPNLLIRTCLGLCGGLHDRVGQLPWDLYLAHTTKRVLLLAWQRPRSLENFFVPNTPELFDWRVPAEAQFGFDDMKHVRNFTQLFDGYPEDRPTDEFWESQMDLALERAISGEYRSVKVLRHRLLGHLGESHLEARLKQQYPDVSSKIHAAPYFGNIFWLFFRPSTPVQAQIDTILSELELVPNHYSAVHCRVRHPKATSASVTVKGKNPKYPADKTGLPWEGDTKEFALEVAAQALDCSRQIHETQVGDTPTKSETSPVPVYFLSDSNDLVRHVVFELQDANFVQATTNWTKMDRDLHQIVSSGLSAEEPSRQSSLGWIRARDVSEETAHIDKQKGRLPEAYYSTFVDLMLAIHAHCVVYGIGYYAAFAAKISGTDCQYLYQQEAWGGQAAKQAHSCPNHNIQ